MAKVIVKVITREDREDRFANQKEYVFQDWLDAGTFLAKFDSEKPNHLRFISAREYA